MRKRLRKKKRRQSDHPVDILLDIAKRVVKRQGLSVDIGSFKQVKNAYATLDDLKGYNVT